MILKISYDPEDWYVDILKISILWSVLWNLVCRYSILKISYDSKDLYVGVLKISSLWFYKLV